MSVRLFAALCIAMWIAAVPVAIAELRPFLFGGQTREARFEIVAGGAETFGFSTYSQRLALNNCLEVLNSVYGRVQPVEKRQAAVAGCRELSAKIIAVSPVNSFAWLTKAMAGAGEEDIEALNAALYQSRITAPMEQWVAELRVGLAETRFDDLDVQNQIGHEADLKLMAESYRGAQSIARRFINDAGFKARIVVLIETLPEETQAHFVRNVRRAAREMKLIS